MSMFDEVINFMQNHSDGQKAIKNSNLSASEVQRVTREVIPKITDRVRQNPRTLEDLMRIIQENKHDPDSMLNSKPGYNYQKVQNEGNDILHAIFGGGNKATQVADDVSQNTGVSVVDISAMMPMIAAMATKLLSGKMDSALQNNQQGGQEKSMNEVLKFLDMNQDGSISDDIGRIVGNLFKG